MLMQTIEDEIIDEFSMFDNWLDKYEYIIDIGKSLNPLDEKDKVEKNLVKGCLSQVWLIAKKENGKVVFNADSDTVITKGLVALLIRVLSGRDPEEIIGADLKFIDQIGLSRHLSPNRAGGLLSMVKKMKEQAVSIVIAK